MTWTILPVWLGAHNVGQLLAGQDKPGSMVQLQVLSAKTGAVIEVELVRADAEEVKLHRALSDWLAHIRDTSTSGLALSETAHVSHYASSRPCVACVSFVLLVCQHAKPMLMRESTCTGRRRPIFA